MIRATARPGPTPFSYEGTLQQRRAWAAYHEAGHAVRALEWQVPVVAISMASNPEDDPELGRHLLGTQYLQPLLPNRASWFDDHVLRICIASAGEAAEMRYRRGRRAELAEWEVEDIENAARFDRQTVRRCLQYIPTTDHNHVIATQIREVDEWIERPDTWRVVQTVARALLRHGQLTGLQLGAVAQRVVLPARLPTERRPS
jgi:hypothetical protein